MASRCGFGPLNRDQRPQDVAHGLSDASHRQHSDNKGTLRFDFPHTIGRPPHVRHTSIHRVSYTCPRDYISQGRLRRQFWPPFAIVEEEKTSLAKEAFPVKADADRVEARARGSIDQTPIILEAQELRKKSSGRNDGGEKSRHDPSLHVNTQVRGETARVKPKRVQIADTVQDLAQHTECLDFAERHAAPYAFTPRREPKESPVDSGYSSSSDILAEKRKQARIYDDQAYSDALRGQGKARGGHHARQASGLSYDSERDHKSHVETTGSPLETRASREAAIRPRLAEVKADALHAVRRGSDTATSLPRPLVFNDDASQRFPSLKPPPLGTLASMNSSIDKPFDNRSATSSRSGTPEPHFKPYVPHSPRVSMEKALEEGRSGRSSGSSSHPGSKRSSREPSPIGSMRRISTFPIMPDHRPHPTSRSSESTSSASEYRPRDAYAPYPSPEAPDVLPYPIDDMSLMPSEEDHRYRPRMHDGVSMPTIPAHRAGLPSPTTRRRLEPLSMPELPMPISGPSSPASDRRLPSGPLPSRPHFPSRRTADEAIPTLKSSPLVTPIPTPTSSPTTAKTPVCRTPCAPPPCPRPKSTRNFNDWYTLDGLPNFDICPSCYNSVFAPTPFSTYFKRARSKDPHCKTRCDFASEWIRLAWLMTMQQGRRDLDLVYAVARIGTSDKCPGNHDDERTWYTLVDRNGDKIDHFDVCKADVRRIEALMPQLHDLFVRAYHGERKTRMCDLRVQSHRFEKYLDALYAVVRTAEVKRRPPNVQAFVDYARQRAQIRECRNDEPLEGRTWHYIQSLPDFTVCEECYSDVVWPHIENGSILASRFIRTPQPHNSGRDDGGRTCQLYSEWMRKIFRDACENENYDKLERRALERRDAERHIKEGERRTRQAMKMVREQDPNADIEGLREQLRQMREDWSKF